MELCSNSRCLADATLRIVSSVSDHGMGAPLTARTRVEAYACEWDASYLLNRYRAELTSELSHGVTRFVWVERLTIAEEA